MSETFAARLARAFGPSDPEADYAKELASWQISHQANRHDLTAAQEARRSTHAAIVRAGLDLDHVRYGMALVQTGAVSDV